MSTSSLNNARTATLVIEPDISMEAIRRRHNATPATLEEFEAEYGPLQPPGGEG